MTIDEQRTTAIHRLETKATLYRAITVWVGVTLLMVVIWAVSGLGYFWPAWVGGGMGIGVIVKAIQAFGPGRNGITESAIQTELAKIGQRDPIAR